MTQQPEGKIDAIPSMIETGLDEIEFRVGNKPNPEDTSNHNSAPPTPAYWLSGRAVSFQPVDRACGVPIPPKIPTRAQSKMEKINVKEDMVDRFVDYVQQEVDKEPNTWLVILYRIYTCIAATPLLSHTRRGLERI